MWTLFVSIDRWCLVFSIAYTAVCIPRYSLQPYSLIPTCLERAGLVLRLKNIFIYCVTDELSADLFIFSFELDICILLKIDCKCKKKPDGLFYICSNVFLPNHQVNITDFVMKAYRDYFGDQGKPFAHHVCCKTCEENLKNSRISKRKITSFVISTIWRERKGHIRDCYFSMINLKGINHKNKPHVQYPDVPFAIRSIPHWKDLLVADSDGNMNYNSDSEHSNMTFVAGDDAYKPKRVHQSNTIDTSRSHQTDTESKTFKRVCSAAVLTSKKDLITLGHTLNWYQECVRELRQFITFQDKGSLAY